ncbi:MAG: tape measure protein, partial [Phascolarctobacterium sp.]
MATVDERVVKMKLDGSEFQSGASKVSSCLDSLKEKLKFKDAGKGLDDISKKTKSLSFDDVALSVSALEKRFSTMGIVGINVINRITDSVINLSRRLTSFVTSGIIQGGITRAMNLENAHFQLQGLLKDEQEVQAVMKNVSDSVDGTAYSLDAAAKVASQLAASGMRAGDQMYSSLRAVAGVAAMTNSSYEDIGMIFTQVAGQGRVMGQDLLQLSSRGMNAAATLGQAMGKSEAEIRDMVSKGKISFQDFASAMDNAFGEHAKKANESFNGAMSNVKASLARIGAEFVSPLIVQNGPFVQFFNTLRERINDIKSEIGPLADMFVKTTTGVVNSMTQMFKKLDVKDYVKSFVNVTEGFGNVANGLLHILKMVRDGFNEVFSTISGKELYDLTKQFRDFTENLKPSAKVLEQIKQVAKGVFSLFDIGVQVVKALGTAISTAFGGSGLGNILEGLLNVAAGFSSWIIGLDESIKKLGLFQGVAKTVGTALRSMLDFLGLVANGFSSIGTAASAVSSKMVSVATTIRNTIGNAFEKTYQVMNKVFSVIKDNITMDDILAGITGGGIVLVVKKITATFDKVAGLVERINDVFGEIFDKNGEKIKNGAEVLKQLLNNLGEALKAFTNNVKSFALLEISAAIAILVNSLRKIAELNAMEVTGGIVAIGAMMGELNMSMKSISKTLDKYDPQKLIQMGIALVGFAKAIEILAKAMSIVGRMDLNQIANGLVGIGGAMAELTIAAKGLNNSNISVKTVLSLVVLTKAVSMLAEPLRKLGQMSWGEVGRGLSAMGGAMAELTAVAKGLSYSKVSIKTSASLIVMAQSVKMIADPLKQLGRMSWDEIKQGLSAMGGAIAEMGAAVGLLGRFGRNNLSASVSILIVTKSLTDIAHALGEFAYYNWDEIKRGLTAMGGALAEIGIVTGALGKIAGISSLIASGSIFIVAKGLGDIAQAFAVFASFNWSEIGRGLVAMGGALAEIGLITGALGKLGGISSLFASGAIFIVAKGLGDIANAFGDFASFDWGEIGRGLVAMGGALAEIGLVTGALGKLAGISGLIGAGTLLLAVQGLDDLAKAFDSFAQYSWDEIGRGLVAMGGAMLEVGVIAGATGALTGIAGLVGAGTITLASKGLDDLAAAFAKFAAFDWEEIKRGLTAMAGALGATALGSLLNTFSGFGAGAIEKVAGPLGILADSVKRWENVKVPDGLPGQLGKLADGIMKFTFAGWGGDVVATVAKPMDVLANAITKWSKITFPTDIGSQLKELSSGVTSFTLAFAGGWSLNAVVGPFGQLADSVKKWSNVIIPNGIGHDLSSLADGVKSFTWAFAGGMSLGAINGPLGDLAGSVKKWNGVTIPKGIKSGLSELADGVKSFSFAFLGGMSLGSINGPLGELAGSVKKWNGVVVPANIGSSLKSLADGVNAFTSVNADIGTTVASVSTLFKALGTLATNAQKLSGVNLPGLAATISS